MNNADIERPVTIDNTSGIVVPRGKRIDLATIDDVRLQMCVLYREAKEGKIETSNATKLCYILAQIGRMIEIHDIEKRINLIEEKL